MMVSDSPRVQDIDADLRQAQLTRARIESDIGELLADLRTLDLTVDTLLELRARASR